MASNINVEYENQIASIVESVMGRVEEIHKEDPDQEIDNLDEIINEEIDARSIYYTDQAYYLAKYHLENGFPVRYNPETKQEERVDEVRWSDVWEMVYNDVYEEVDEQIKEKYGE